MKSRDFVRKELIDKKAEDPIEAKSVEKDKKVPSNTGNSKINLVPVPTYIDLERDVSPLKDKSGNSSGNIKVICRFRPLNEKEKNISQELCVDFIDSQTCSIKSTVRNLLPREKTIPINSTLIAFSIAIQLKSKFIMMLLDILLTVPNNKIRCFGRV